MATTEKEASESRRSGVAPRHAGISRPAAQHALRRGFRMMNRGMVLLWRLGLGPLLNSWPPGFGRMLVVEHTGRTSGAVYRAPLNYTCVDEHVFCVAAFGARTDWYRNAMVSPRIIVWLPSGRWSATAVDANDDPRRLDLVRGVLIDSGFAAPLFGLYPKRMSDAELERTTAEYRVVRIELDHRHAHEGPADLAWIWVPVFLLSIARLVRRRARRRS